MISTTFRTDDPARWGIGKRATLDATDVDRNFWELKSAIEGLLENPPDPIEIASFTVASGALSIHLTTGSVIGPLPLPVLSWRWRGDWLPNVPYLQLDVFSVATQGLFVVLLDHTSAMTFDAAAVDGFSQPIYKELIAVQTPGLTVSDGTITVHNVTQIAFSGPVAMGDPGGGVALVEFLGVDDVAQLATVSLSSADLLGAHTTPTVIIAAPGAGKAIDVLGSFYMFTKVTTNYAAGGSAGLYYDGGTNRADAGDSGIVVSIASKTGTGGPAAAGLADPSVFDNKAIVYKPASAAFTTGDGTLKINVVYTVVPT